MKLRKIKISFNPDPNKPAQDVISSNKNKQRITPSSDSKQY